MRIQTIALFFLLSAFPASTATDASLCFYLECSPGQQCIDLAYDDNGKTESVVATPVQVLGRVDLESARVQVNANIPQALEIELSREASRKFEKITGDNIGKRLMVVFDNKILTAPTINARISERRLTIYAGRSQQGPFWERAPWLQDLIRGSAIAGSRSILIYVVIALAASISAFIFVVLPRMRKTRESGPE